MFYFVNDRAIFDRIMRFGQKKIADICRLCFFSSQMFPRNGALYSQTSLVSKRVSIFTTRTCKVQKSKASASLGAPLTFIEETPVDELI